MSPQQHEHEPLSFQIDTSKTHDANATATMSCIPVISPLVNTSEKMEVAPEGPRRLPCKARGMPSSHNPDTAFFLIASDAPHGLLLTCSHPDCKESGRRFRFCQVCTLPVAKRNFLRRHGHGLIHSTKQCVDETEAGKLPGTCSVPNSPCSSATDHNALRTVSRNQDDDPSPSDSSTTEESSLSSHELDTSNKNDSRRPESPPVGQGRSRGIHSTGLPSTKRQRLAFEPPSAVVTHVSNQHSVVSPTGSANDGVTTQTSITEGNPTERMNVLQLSAEERQWLTLLRSRPKAEGDSGHMSTWMERVLDMSGNKTKSHTSLSPRNRNTQHASLPNTKPFMAHDKHRVHRRENQHVPTNYYSTNHGTWSTTRPSYQDQKAWPQDYSRGQPTDYSQPPTYDHYGERTSWTEYHPYPFQPSGTSNLTTANASVDFNTSIGDDSIDLSSLFEW